MKKTILTLITAGTLMTSCCNKECKTQDEANPLLSKFETPYGVPPFGKIKDEDFLPAIKKGMALQNERIEKIVSNTTKPTFLNTIVALEESGTELETVAQIFGNLRSANTNDQIDATATEISPLMSKHSDQISFNDKLFAKVKTVYDNKTSFNLDEEDTRLLEKTYKGFVKSGANLSKEDKEKVSKINAELSLLSIKFGKNLLTETNSFTLVIENEKDLSGLPESIRQGAAETAKGMDKEGKWAFTLQKPSWIPFLTYADNRALREKLYKAMYNRGNNDNANDNKEVIKKIVALRAQKAKIMGYSNWSELCLDDRMAGTPNRVFDLLTKVWEPAIVRAKEETADMQKMIKSEKKNFKLQSWDWWYYSGKVRKAKYDLDEEQIRPYFELNNVREGAFMVANKLYGLKITEIKDIPVYHPEVKAYKVSEKDGSLVGVLYTDFFPRASKRAGAWMTSYRKEYKNDKGERVAPIISIVCNFSKPVGDKPALLSYDEVTTLFHEFGHALHGLLSQCKYYSISGTSVERDFVELPSQVMEHWPAEAEVLAMYAKHYKTGKPMPKELINKLVKSSTFNQGFATVEYLAASYLDMKYHTLKDANIEDVNKFEVDQMRELGLIEEIIPRYRSTYFAHIFSGGYSSGYYSYLWAEVLDSDAFEAYKETGNIFDQTTALKFRQNILEQGGKRKAMDMYKGFRGKEPSIDPLLKNRGLL
ncbi:M3 family metallopeptidase [Halosquirtibacter xylanolyticus]|uniref:M3 family metallopeptidase n=1 Tax=Halosquirtibacter xylanolyticus TaxID=3374599 RepID=UPI003749FF9D|nr:M3 family metallopeptidase [Prolixibacteraceae bacterium]